MDKKLTGFTNIQKLDPDIIVDLKYATEDNFTGKVIYDFTTAIARTGTAYKLAEASAIVKKQGYRLKVWDAYRPVKSQKNYLKFILILSLWLNLIQISAIKKGLHLT